MQLAKIHGCIAPLFFSLVVAIAVCTSRWWREGRIVRCIASGRLKRLAVVTAALAYLQLVLGAQLRHVAPEANGDLFRIALVFHLVVAAILFFDVVFLFLLAIKNLRGEKVLLRPTQFLLGTGGPAAVSRYGDLGSQVFLAGRSFSAVSSGCGLDQYRGGDYRVACDYGTRGSRLADSGRRSHGRPAALSWCAEII